MKRRFNSPTAVEGKRAVDKCASFAIVATVPADIFIAEESFIEFAISPIPAKGIFSTFK